MDYIDVRNIANAIILNAVRDYEEVIRRYKAGVSSSRVIYNDVREFFLSDYFYHLSNGLDGQKILDDLDNQLEFELPKRKPYTYWTQEELDQLMRMKADGMLFPDIARTLGRTTDTCRKKYIKLVKEGYYERVGISKEPTAGETSEGNCDG